MQGTDHFAEYLNAAVTLLVGVAAFAIYWIQKYHERQSAARIIVADVRHAEQVVLVLLERNHVDIWSKDVLRENNWSRYKHLFAGRLSSDDFAAFNRFFLAANEMSDALGRMRHVHYAALEEKARLTQQAVAAIPESEEASYLEELRKIKKRFDRDGYLFAPDEPRQRYFLNLQQMGRLSTTPGFNKLVKLASEI